MQSITTDPYKGSIILANTFNTALDEGSTDATPYFNNVGDTYVATFNNLQGVKTLNTFIYDTNNETPNRYLDICYRTSVDNTTWSEWLELKGNINNFPTVDTKEPLYLQIRFTRVGENTISYIRLLYYTLTGEIDRNVVIGDGSEAITIDPQTSLIFKSPYIYKVFKVVGYALNPIDAIAEKYLYYRFSQDNSRTWTEWEHLTKANITTASITPTRFFQIEYRIDNTTDDAMSVQDIMLIGDFQNVTKDYFKTNLFGIRDNCSITSEGYYDQDGNFIAFTSDNTAGVTSSTATTTASANCANSSSSISTSITDTSSLFNPYDLNTATTLLTQMSSEAELIFGHDVIYFCTDPDIKGQDFSLHEYQLYNVVCKGNLKVAVENNQFPDSQIVFNQFNLDLFETMTVNITKEQFKTVFGEQRRPAVQDFMYFCTINRMFQIEHAQAYRNFNNAAIYYKIVLKKYNQKKNVDITVDEDIKDVLGKLTKNSTLDTLFGKEQKKDIKSVVDTQQLHSLSEETVRLDFLASVDREEINNAGTIISKTNYNLAYRDKIGVPIVRYKNVPNVLNEGDNMSFTAWFKMIDNRYVAGEVYTLFQYYDVSNFKGWSAYLHNDVMYVVINDKRYDFSLTGHSLEVGENPMAFVEGAWYCYVLNINQRQGVLQQYIYRRNVDILNNEEEDASMINSTVLRLIYSNEQALEKPYFFELSDDIYPSLLSSEMHITNIRLFNDIIPQEVHNKILNQYLVGNDTKWLLLADNAQEHFYMDRYVFN